MAINDISLTAGMRANLTSLQGTVALLNRTQQRLSTGKSVNSALDNPVNYFAAQSLNNRASDLAGYKDGMANAVQTIQAANQGVTGITNLLNAAKAIAQAVPGKSAGSGNATATLTLAGVKLGDTVSIDNLTYTISAASNGTRGVKLETTDGATAINLANAVNAGAGTMKVSSISGSTLNLADAGQDISNGAAAVHKIAFTSGVTSFSDTIVPKTGDQVTPLIAQYKSIMDQITAMAGDSSFQGVNLLAAGTNLTVTFSNTAGSSLTLSGSDSTATGLGFTAQLYNPTNWTGAATDGATQVAAIASALTNLQSTSSSLSNNLAIINARQDFSTQLGNVLTTGADNLTLADTNQEGANMLMLQTRNSLGTTALSLSSQAAQSVLRLFA